ncbi:hypothetical protein NP681_004206 [Salmonella enterica]|nr:hypothetical protein [Salmonella enterica]EJR3519430.1 hypothetical protein [Salmonella enterica]
MTEPKIKPLAPPIISGMNEDNIIDKNILTEDIIFLIPSYDNPPPLGDQIQVHFGDILSYTYIISPDNQTTPILIKMNPVTIPSGKYQVYYEVRDKVGNPNQCDPVPVVVTGMVELLPAPSVEGAVAGTLDISTLTGGILIVDIQSDGGKNLTTGDFVTVTLSCGNTSLTSNHIAFTTMATHHLNFSVDDVFPGNWCVSYVRKRGAVSTWSAVLPLKLTGHVTPPGAGLEAPVLPQAMNGSLDLSLLTEPVAIKIPDWKEITPGDAILLYIGGSQVGDYTITENNLYQPHLIKVALSDILLGKQNVYYTMTPPSGRTVTSPSVSVAFFLEYNLKAPRIIGADDNHIVKLFALTTDYVEMVIPADESRFYKNDIIQGVIGDYEAIPHNVFNEKLNEHKIRFKKDCITVGAPQDVYYQVTGLGNTGTPEKSPVVKTSFLKLSAPYLDGNVTSYDMNGHDMIVHIPLEVWAALNADYDFTLKIGTNESVAVSGPDVIVRGPSITPGPMFFSYSLKKAGSIGETLWSSEVLAVNVTVTDTLECIKNGYPFYLQNVESGLFLDIEPNPCRYGGSNALKESLCGIKLIYSKKSGNILHYDYDWCIYSVSYGVGAPYPVGAYSTEIVPIDNKYTINWNWQFKEVAANTYWYYIYRIHDSSQHHYLHKLPETFTNDFEVYNDALGAKWRIVLA